MPPKSRNSTPTVKKGSRGKQKAIFARELNECTPSPEEVHIPHRQRFVPPSPNRAQIRALRRSGEKPSCLLFGPFREFVYAGYFICSNCKLYEDAVSSGTASRVNRKSKRFKCTANHTDFTFPTHQLFEPDDLPAADSGFNRCRVSSPDCAVGNNRSKVSHHSDSPEDGDENGSCDSSNASEVGGDVPFFDDELVAYYGALSCLEAAFMEKLKAQAERFESVLQDTKTEVARRFENEISKLKELIERQKEEYRELKEENNALSRHMNYYKRKAKEDKDDRKAQSIPLDEAVIETVNKLLSSRQRYKLLSDKNKASLIAKAVFNPEFCHGVALEEIMKEAKQWLRQKVFTPVEILGQMDLHGGTLNYEGLKVLNDFEAAAYKGEARQIRDRVLPTPACLQKVAQILEREGDRLCPYEIIHTDFGEGIEFDYGKATRLVINAFGLEEQAKERSINVSASIDAARVTKNICHTSAGFKMSDPQGCDPLKSMRSFLVDEHSLRDLQSRNTVFYLRLYLLKKQRSHSSYLTMSSNFFAWQVVRKLSVLMTPKTWRSSTGDN